MKAPCALAALLVTWVSSADRIEAADRQPPPACRNVIDAQLPRWQLSAPPPDLAAYAKRNNLATNVAQADFDNNGTNDTAVLLDVPGAGNLHERQYIAVCLTQGRNTRAHLIRQPSQNGISLKIWLISTHRMVAIENG